jgi:hypothetical protein
MPQRDELFDGMRYIKFGFDRPNRVVSFLLHHIKAV